MSTWENSSRSSSRCSGTTSSPSTSGRRAGSASAHTTIRYSISAILPKSGGGSRANTRWSRTARERFQKPASSTSASTPARDACPTRSLTAAMHLRDDASTATPSRTTAAFSRPYSGWTRQHSSKATEEAWSAERRHGPFQDRPDRGGECAIDAQKR